MSGKILVIGSANTDMIVRSRKIPAPGETVIGGELTTAAGGKGANQAVAAARAGGAVTFICKLGEDTFGKEALQGYQKEGMNLKYILRDPEKPSGVALILVDEAGENCISVAPGANATLAPREIEELEAVIAQADYLLMQLEIPLATVETAARIANRHRTKVILNPAPARSLPKTLLANIDILTPNESETELLTGIRPANVDQAIKASQALQYMGVKSILITLGKKGGFSSETKEIIPARQVKAVDTTAAGDVFNGAMTVALSDGKEMLEAIKFANTAAALSVAKLGAQPSIPSRKEIEKFLME